MSGNDKKLGTGTIARLQPFRNQGANMANARERHLICSDSPKAKEFAAELRRAGKAAQIRSLKFFRGEVEPATHVHIDEASGDHRAVAIEEAYGKVDGIKIEPVALSAPSGADAQLPPAGALAPSAGGAKSKSKGKGKASKSDNDEGDDE